MNSNYKQLDKNFITSTNDLDIINNKTYERNAIGILETLKYIGINTKNLKVIIKPEIKYSASNVKIFIDIEVNCDIFSTYEVDTNKSKKGKLQKFISYYSFVIAPNKTFNEIEIKDSFVAPLWVKVDSKNIEFTKLEGIFDEETNMYYDYDEVIDINFKIRELIENTFRHLSLQSIFKSGFTSEFLDYTFERAIAYKNTKSPGSGDQFRDKIENSVSRLKSTNKLKKIKDAKNKLLVALNTNEDSPFISSKLIYNLGEEDNFDRESEVENDILNGEYDPIEIENGVKVYSWRGSDIVQSTIEVDMLDSRRIVYILDGEDEFKTINDLFEEMT